MGKCILYYITEEEDAAKNGGKKELFTEKRATNQHKYMYRIG